MTPALAWGLSIAGSGTALCGAAMLRWSTARASAGALIVAGALFVATAVADSPTLMRVTADCAAAAAAGALLLYPTARWRDPVAMSAIGILGACAAISAVDTRSIAVTGYVFFATVVGCVWWLLERSGPERRRPLIWASWGWAGAGLIGATVFFMGDGIGGVTSDRLTGIAVGLLVVAPAGMVFGVVRPAAIDVAALIAGTIVVVATFFGFIAASSLVTGLAEVVLGAPLPAGQAVAVSGLLIFAVPPTIRLLRGTIDRILFGERPDPLTATQAMVSRLGDDLSSALDAIRETFVLPYQAET